MKIRWKEIAERIDAMNLRQRAMLFAVGVLVLVALPYNLIVSPSFAAQRLILQRMHQDQGRIEAVQKELANLLASQKDDVSSENQLKLSTLQQELERIERRVRDRQSLLVPADKVPELIRGVLKKSARLQLVSFTTLRAAPMLPAQAADQAAEAPAAPEPPNPALAAAQATILAATAGKAGVPAPAAGKSPPAAPAAAKSPRAAAAPARPAAPEADLFKQGFEITVTGGYLDLLQFLAEVEKSPWRLLWGRVELQAGKYPAVTMKLTVYTLSTDRAAVSL